jgi:uncharacterized protein
MSKRLPPHIAKPRAWQRMLSGRRLNLLDPEPADIEIEDIAHGLARVARWNGQTIGPHAFSVAQHVVLVEDIAAELNPEWQPAWRLATLLHDAAEYVIGDLISPFKTAIGLDYKAFELRLLEAIHRRFGLPPVLPEEIISGIKGADRIAAYYEATGLAGNAYLILSRCRLWTLSAYFSNVLASSSVLLEARSQDRASALILFPAARRISCFSKSGK